MFSIYINKLIEMCLKEWNNMQRVTTAWQDKIRPFVVCKINFLFNKSLILKVNNCVIKIE